MSDDSWMGPIEWIWKDGTVELLADLEVEEFWSIEDALASGAEAAEPVPGQPGIVKAGKAIQASAVSATNNGQAEGDDDDEPPPPRGLRGGEFIFDTYAVDAEPIWGRGSAAIWTPGEGFMLAGDQGLGKSTLAQQLVLARIGVHEPEFLGLPVTMLRAGRKVLYLAMDRPRQVAKSFARMVSEEEDRARLNKCLIAWLGPLAHLNLPKYPHHLVEWINKEHRHVSDVVIDSYKDLAPGLSNDDVGAAINIAVQGVIASGREVVGLHHNRKPQPGNKSPHELGDIYGSTWLTAGMGSVALLKGKPGDRVVEFVHLKQPVEPVGPLRIAHDHARGRSTIYDGVNVLTLLAAKGARGATLDEAATALYGSTDESYKQRARRQLKGLVKDGTARHEPGAAGGRGGGAKAEGRWILNGQ